MNLGRTTSVLGLLALATALVPGAAQAVPTPATTSSRIGQASPSATYSESHDTVRVTVRYRCTNAAGQQHFLALTETQKNRATYILGWRGDTGGTLAATCTGATVKKTFSLLRSSYTEAPTPGAKKGHGTLEVSLLPRATADQGGWYVATGEDLVRTRTVAISPVK